MSGAATGFVPGRLKQAREARGLSLIGLAELVGVSSSSISQYEKGDITPRGDTARKMAFHVNVPLPYMFDPGFVIPDGNLFWRSMSAATKLARTRAERRYEWFKEMVGYLQPFFDFPAANIPVFDLPSDFREITNAMIEDMAERVRDRWQLGSGPIPSLTRTAEANGVFIALGSIGSEHLDAFSEFDKSNRPFMFLSSDKNVMVRTRFDVAHELFHMIAHRNVNKTTLNTSSDYALLEKQAHRFSAAFQMPAQSFSDELWGVSLDSFRSMKARWKVSIGSMVFRAEQLGMINETEAKRLRIGIGRRGWRKGEPLDDLPVEKPRMIARAFELLVSEKVKTPEQILTDLPLPPADMEELAGLDPGFFVAPREVDDPVLKQRSNVVSFPR